MKTNGDMRYGGKLRPEYAQTWADYFVRYVRAYEAEGIPMWGLTVQNEALATQVWESCVFTAEEERDFVRDYLGPTLRRAGLSDVKLMFWDHNRGLAYQRAEVMYDDPEAAQYVWGLAFHWYTGDHFDNVRMVHDAWPDKGLLYTEAGMGASWETAARLAKSIILDLNHWASGWTYWNMLLDETNGPRHAGGLGGSNPVQLDTRTGHVTFNPSFHAFAHFSRFIRPGARRIACTSSSDDFIATAFVNGDGRVAVVILNTSKVERLCQMWVAGQVIKHTAPPHAIVTMCSRNLPPRRVSGPCEGVATGTCRGLANPNPAGVSANRNPARGARESGNPARGAREPGNPARGAANPETLRGVLANPETLRGCGNPRRVSEHRKERDGHQTSADPRDRRGYLPHQRVWPGEHVCAGGKRALTAHRRRHGLLRSESHRRVAHRQALRRGHYPCSP